MSDLFELNQSTPFKIKQGATWNQIFEWIQRSNNLPVDLTGCTAAIKLENTRTKEIETSFSSDDSPAMITIEELTGKVILNINTQSIPVGFYNTDIKLTFPSGSVKYSQTIAIQIEKSIS